LEILLCAFLLAGLPATSQQNNSTEQIARLRQLSPPAGAVFSGTVLSIQPAAAGNQGEIEILEIRFRVEHAIRGIQDGQVITVRE
jgi:hypothetical protein